MRGFGQRETAEVAASRRLGLFPGTNASHELEEGPGPSDRRQIGERGGAGVFAERPELHQVGARVAGATASRRPEDFAVLALLMPFAAPGRLLAGALPAAAVGDDGAGRERDDRHGRGDVV